MRTFLRKLALVFSAGCLGGLVNSIAVWGFGAAGITALLGVGIAPLLTVPWLYPRIVWGGIWGVLFLLPLKGSFLKKGLAYSLGPSLVQLFIVFPLKAKKGMMGLELGALTPLFVLLFNGFWGVAAALWLEAVSGEQGKSSL